MKKRLVISMAIVVGLFLFLSMFLWAASEFYTIQLESFAQDKHRDWNNVERIVRSVQGVTKVQIDRQTNTLRMFCVSRGCSEPIVNNVIEKLRENRYRVKAQGTLTGQQGFPKVEQGFPKVEQGFPKVEQAPMKTAPGTSK